MTVRRAENGEPVRGALKKREREELTTELGHGTRNAKEQQDGCRDLTGVHKRRAMKEALAVAVVD